MSYQDDNNRDVLPPLPSDRRAYSETSPDEQAFDERRQTSQPVPQKSGCSKGCLWGAAGCGCLTVLVVGVLAILGWRFGKAFIDGLSTDPAVIKTRTLEMVEITPPAGLEPKLAMNIWVAKVVIYQSPDEESVLTLVQFDQGLGDNQQFRQDFTKEFKGGGQQDKEPELKIEKKDTKDMKIRGQDVKVDFSDAKTPDGKAYKLVEAEFRGKVGQIQLRLQLPEEKYDEEEVNTFLESIK